MAVVGGSEEIVPERRHVGQSVQNDIHVVIGLDVVQTHNPWEWRNGGMEEWRNGNQTWEVFGSIQSNGEFGGVIESGHMFPSECWLQHIL